MKYLNSAVASDGGTAWLALEDKNGNLHEVKLDKKIGTNTPNRIYINGVLVSIADEGKWIQIFQETIAESSFQNEEEKQMIEYVISALINRK